jgi:hypothetical protein
MLTDFQEPGIMELTLSQFYLTALARFAPQLASQKPTAPRPPDYNQPMTASSVQTTLDTTKLEGFASPFFSHVEPTNS